MEDETGRFTSKEFSWDQVVSDTEIKRLLFRHPELFDEAAPNVMDKKFDLYSFAMVLTEIFTRETPHAEGSIILGWKQILEEVLFVCVCKNYCGPCLCSLSTKLHSAYLQNAD